MAWPPRPTTLTRSQTGTLGTSRMSVCIILYSPPIIHLINRGKHDTMNHHPPTSHDIWRCQVLSMYTNPHRWLPNGHPQPIHLLPRHMQWQRPSHLWSKHIHSQSVIHSPWWTCIEPHLAHGYDWPASRNSLSSSPAGNLSSPFTNGASSSSGVQPTGIVQSPLSQVCKVQKCGPPLSRCDTGIMQHKCHMTFMRAIHPVACTSEKPAWPIMQVWVLDRYLMPDPYPYPPDPYPGTRAGLQTRDVHYRWWPGMYK
jgi:hypothetical protein